MTRISACDIFLSIPNCAKNAIFLLLWPFDEVSPYDYFLAWSEVVTISDNQCTTNNPPFSMYIMSQNWLPGPALIWGNICCLNYQPYHQNNSSEGYFQLNTTTHIATRVTSQKCGLLVKIGVPMHGGRVTLGEMSERDWKADSGSQDIYGGDQRPHRHSLQSPSSAITDSLLNIYSSDSLGCKFSAI